MLLPVFVALAGLAGRSDPPIKVTLNSDVYAVGEDAARVHVKVAQDGYIVILRADVDGRIRVIVPVDPGVDNFLRGGKDYDVRGRGDRDDTFQIESREGTGTVLAAWSASPFTFDHFVRGDHWDYRVLGGVPSDQDAEAVLLDVVREMAGEDGHFDYDVVHYQVASGGGGGYGHTHVAIGVGYGWGWGYNPWSFGISFGYGGCWACWPYYGYGFYPYGYGFYPYGYYPYYPYYYGGYAYYPYAHYPYGYAAYPYYLHSPYTFKPGGAGGVIVQPRPRTGGVFTAGFSGGTRSGAPRLTAPGFAPRTRVPASGAGNRGTQIDPRARDWDRQRMDAGQHRQPPQNAPRTREQPHNNGGGSHGGQPHGSGGQAQPRSREPHQFSQLSETGRGWNRSSSRSYSERSYGGWGGFDRRQPASNQFRGFESRGFGGRVGTPGFSGGRSSPGFSGGGFRGSGGGGGGARMSAPANGRHR